jgi:hypothetical protein
MVVLTLCVFTSPQQKHVQIDHPLRALQYFLELMSAVDWKHQQVTVFGVEPIRSSFFSVTVSAPSADLDRDNENLMNLASIVHPFAQRFRDNFILGDEAAAAGSGGGGGAGAGGGLSDNDSLGLLQPNDHSAAGVCGIMVADPVQPSRNICAQKHHDAESLRRIFLSGLEDMEDLLFNSADSVMIGEPKTNPVNKFFVIRHLEFQILTKGFQVDRFSRFAGNPDVISQAVHSTGVFADPCQKQALVIKRLA